jgi:hypothetical protein
VSVSPWKATRYDETYQATLISLERRHREDDTFSLADARRVLGDLYVQDGNNWVGRGELQDIVMQATIDAYECFIAGWEADDSSLSCS